MPVARILTRFPERTNALAEDLQHRGYTVEIGMTGETGLAPADLEIDFEICNNEEALQRATELARQWSADVAVSPGLGDLTPAAEPAPAEADHYEDGIIVIPPAEQTAHAVQPIQHQAVDVPVSAHEEQMPADVEPHYAAEPIETPITLEPAPRQEFVPPIAAEMANVDEVPLRYETGHENVHANEGESEDVSREHRLDDESKAIAEPDAAQPDYAQKARELSAAALNSGKALAASSGEWLRKNSESVRQQIDLRLAEIRARREVRQEQAERRRAVARERAVELEAAREAAAARLQELLRERGGLVDTQPAPPQVQALDDSQQERRTAVSGAASFFRRHLGFTFHSGISPQLEAVLMGVAAACALFVLGLAVASFHASPAISKTVNVPQQQRYNGVTVQAGGVTVKPSASSSAAAVAAPPTNNVAPNAGKPAARPNPGRPSPVKARSSDRENGNTRHIGDDVVIRRLDQPKAGTPHGGGGSDVTIRQLGSSKPATGNTSAGPKKISDMD